MARVTVPTPQADLTGKPSRASVSAERRVGTQGRAPLRGGRDRSLRQSVKREGLVASTAAVVPREAARLLPVARILMAPGRAPGRLRMLEDNHGVLRSDVATTTSEATESNNRRSWGCACTLFIDHVQRVVSTQKSFAANPTRSRLQLVSFPTFCLAA